MATSRIKTSSVLQGFPKSRSLLAGNAAYSPDNFESIATVIVGSGGSSSITFSSIPGTYANLQIRSLMQTNRSGYVIDQLIWQFNSDTGSNYSWHYLAGGQYTTPTAEAGAGTSTTRITYPGINSSVAANVFSVSIMDILDYSNTNKYKTTRELSGFDVNGTTGTGNMGGTVTLGSGSWRSTSAITSITINKTDGSNFNQYSKFALYGIRD